MSAHDSTFIAIEGVRIDRLDDGDGLLTLTSSVYDAVLEDTAHRPEEVDIYVSSNDRIDTVYVGIGGFTRDALTDAEGKRLTEFVFALLDEEIGLAPTSIAVVTDYRANMSSEPECYLGRSE